MESHQHLLVFSETCRLSTLHSQKNWQVLRDSHPPGRFWRPTRPLEHLGPMVPEAGSAPAPAVWKTAMHLLTPLGREFGGAGRLRSVSSALQVRRAAIITTAPKVDARAGLAPAWDSFADCRMAALPTRENRTAAQVTRREKTSLTSVLSDRGLRFGGAGGCSEAERRSSRSGPRPERSESIAPAPCGLKVRCADY